MWKIQNTKESSTQNHKMYFCLGNFVLLLMLLSNVICSYALHMPKTDVRFVGLIGAYIYLDTHLTYSKIS